MRRCIADIVIRQAWHKNCSIMRALHKRALASNVGLVCVCAQGNWLAYSTNAITGLVSSGILQEHVHGCLRVVELQHTQFGLSQVHCRTSRGLQLLLPALDWTSEPLHQAEFSQTLSLQSTSINHSKGANLSKCSPQSYHFCQLGLCKVRDRKLTEKHHVFAQREASHLKKNNHVKKTCAKRSKRIHENAPRCPCVGTRICV